MNLDEVTWTRIKLYFTVRNGELSGTGNTVKMAKEEGKKERIVNQYCPA